MSSTSNINNDFIRQLDTILDTVKGLAYCCDSEEFYKEMLLTYLDNQKYDSIEDAYQKEDWENYRVFVHALKSTSLSIGANRVSEQAKSLEMAAKENNIGFIREHHGSTMENYRKLLFQLQKILWGPVTDVQTVQERTETLPQILVVDDDSMNLRIAEKMLNGQFQVESVDSGEKALDFLKDRHPDLILLDLHMPGMDGFEVMKKIQADDSCRDIPVIFLTADDDRATEVKCFKEGALDFITKPFVADIMIQRVSRILQLDRLQKNLQEEVEKQTWRAEERRRKVERMSLQIMRTLAGTIDAKDKYTNGHSTRVAEYAREIAKRVGKGEKEQEDIYYMGLLHDIGKIGILKDYDRKYKACISEHDDFSNFTIMVVKDAWSIYGGIFFYKAVFLLLFGFCIFAVRHLIRRLLVWQQAVNVRLKDAADEAVQATQAKSQFLAQMSHEIRTPINAVLGMNEMILRESEDEDICEYAENIQSAGKTLLALINSILDFSKIEDGKMEIVPVQYDTLNLIGDLVNMISDKAEKKDLLLELQVDEKLPYTLYGDDVRVRQIIINLLTNAVKYTREGKVTLVIQRQEVTDGAENIILHVEVIDTGIGIRQEDMGRLFESFQRLDEEKNHNVEGTGLGISIVQSLLKMMGSSLEVESEYGKGSRFYFDLKQRIVDQTPIGNNFFQKEKMETEDKGYLYAPDAEILVVDDNQMNLKVAVGLLKRSDIKVDTASSGMECIRMVKKKQYDIIFMDHMMPEMDGIETMKALRERESLPANTKIIVMTANAIAGAKEQYLAEGFDSYLSKPIVVDGLEKALAEYLPEEKVSFRHKEKKKAAGQEPVEHIEPVEHVEPELSQDLADEDSFTQEELQIFAIQIPELDVKTGLAYCAESKMFYIEMLNEFVNGKKDEELAEFLRKEDWDNYRITVHALKGNAKTIGAMELSEEARMQEMAAKEKHTEEVTGNHQALVEHYKVLQDLIHRVIDRM